MRLQLLLGGDDGTVTERSLFPSPKGYIAHEDTNNIMPS